MQSHALRAVPVAFRKEYGIIQNPQLGLTQTSVFAGISLVIVQFVYMLRLWNVSYPFLYRYI